MKNLSIKIKLILSIFALSTLCILITVFISYTSSKAALDKVSHEQLSTMLAISKKNVEDYYKRTKIFTELLSSDRLTEGLFLTYESAFYGAGYSIGKDQVIDSESFKQLDQIYSSRILERLVSYDVANFLLVNITGQIVFSAKPNEYGVFRGRSLTKGELKNSQLAQCVQSAKGAKEGSANNIFYADYEYYSQFKRVMAFYCLNVFAEFPHLSEGISKGDLLGTVVVEIDPDKITSLLSSREGMGTTGQNYIVGTDGLLRSDLFINKEKFNVINSHRDQLRIENNAITSLLREKKEMISSLIDVNGHDVLSAMTTINIDGKVWVLVSEKQNSEIFSSIRELLKKVFSYSLVVLAIVVIVGMVLSKKLLGPIMKASEILVTVCDSLNADSNNLSQSALSLAESSKEQAHNVQSTVQAVTEITATIAQNNTNAKNSESLARQSLETAEDGRKVVAQMMESMSDINKGNQNIIENVAESNRQMNEIAGMIAEIGNRTKIINNIVSKTRLLSFNASVEASRAGESGKGFAVVAEEVGKLAYSSGSSAKEISDLLAESINKVELIVRETSKGIETVSVLGREKVKIGQETAQQCSNVFDEIVTSFNQVSSLVTDIAHASDEQNSVMAGIQSSIIRLDAGTGQSSQIASESAEAANKLANSSRILEGVVQNIQAVIHGVKNKS